MVSVLVAALTGCGGGSTDVPGGIDISSGSQHLNLVAYATPKIGFDVVLPAFRQIPQGSDIGFSQSYGASGDQSRKVARGLPADVVNFSVEPDVTRLVKADVVDKDWQTQFPNNSVPFGSVVALVVRQGNPKNIRTWDDLLKPGVEVITPNPGSSGSAKWNLLAPYAAKSNGGADPQAGLDYITKLVRDHVKVLPKSGREATSAFHQGQGDVLISYENEAIMLSRKNATAAPADRIDYLLPETTFKIENPVAIVNTSSNKPAARTFVDYLFSPAGQELWAKAGFRPVDPAVVSATANLFPGHIAKLWTIADLGGWKLVDKELFGSDGAITKIYNEEVGG
ncbi:sulfate ABC transporter substrate-binding protein [Gordonia sp. (in: high G+C Gram-positive bacteria)]|uniref:sulfate ABC transporter substrate-binding protein n=1 Tax=Gordonia sp. (in: high G+C Gram-positive bacteria) TaxID=84139 RepID=UPI003C70FBE4